jgi:hypothetical protein
MNFQLLARRGVQISGAITKLCVLLSVSASIAAGQALALTLYFLG